MAISDSDLQKLASLTRVRLSDDERQPVVDSLNSILSLIDELQQIDVEAIDAMAHVQGSHNPLRTRAPEPTAAYSQEQVFDNAPQQQDGHFLVPKVIE